MNKFWMIFLTTLVLLSACSGEKVDLSIQLNKGETLDYKVSTTQQISQSMMGQKIEISQLMEFTYHFEVLEVGADEYTLSAQIKSLNFEQKDGMINLTFNSENVDDSLSSFFNVYLEQIFTLKINKKGEIIDLSGSEKLLPDFLDEGTKDIIAKQMDLSNQKNSMSGIFALLPKKGVNKNSKWTENIKLEDELNMSMTINYILSDISENEIRINSEGTIDASLKSSEILPANADLKGTLSGEIFIKPQSGITIKSSGSQTINGELSTFGMKIPMEIHTVTQVTLL